MKKNYIIIAIIVLLIIFVFVLKQMNPNGTNSLHDKNCTHDHEHNEECNVDNNLNKNNENNENNKNNENNNENNEKNNEKQYTLYNFSSKLCPACSKVKPIYEKIVNEYNNKINFVYVDVENEYKLANKYDIMYTPTFVVVDVNGNVINKKSGYMEYNEFNKFVESVIK